MSIKKLVKRFTAWSYSRFVEHRLCPLKAKLNHLDRIREPKNDAMQRGADVHDVARDYVTGKLTKCPEALKPAKPWLDLVKKQFKKKILGAIVEEQWGFTAAWEPCRWDDWTNCWLRVKLDAAYYEDPSTLVVYDWKTGKLRPELTDEYLEQLELYVLGVLLALPHVLTVKVQLVYTDLGLVYPPEPLMLSRGALPGLKKSWAGKVKPMLADTRFAPRPNDKCRWCFYGQSGKLKGGPGLCKF